MKPFVALTVAALSTTILKAAPPAEQFRLEGQPYKPSVPVIWDATVTNLPHKLTVYRVLPQTFSKETVSNLLTVSGFTWKTMQESADKKTMSWRHYENNKARLVRSLDLAPTYGYISYHDYQAVGTTNAGGGVPSREEVEKMAFEWIEKLGGDTNQIVPILIPAPSANALRSIRQLSKKYPASSCAA